MTTGRSVAAGFRHPRHRDHEAWWSSTECGCTSSDPLARVAFLVLDEKATELHGTYVYNCLACGTTGVTWQRELVGPHRLHK